MIPKATKASQNMSRNQKIQASLKTEDAESTSLGNYRFLRQERHPTKGFGRQRFSGKEKIPRRRENSKELIEFQENVF